MRCSVARQRATAGGVVRPDSVFPLHETSLHFETRKTRCGNPRTSHRRHARQITATCRVAAAHRRIELQAEYDKLPRILQARAAPSVENPLQTIALERPSRRITGARHAAGALSGMPQDEPGLRGGGTAPAAAPNRKPRRMWRHGTGLRCLGCDDVPGRIDTGRPVHTGTRRRRCRTRGWNPQRSRRRRCTGARPAIVPVPAADAPETTLEHDSHGAFLCTFVVFNPPTPSPTMRVAGMRSRSPAHCRCCLWRPVRNLPTNNRWINPCWTPCSATSG